MRKRDYVLAAVLMLCLAGCTVHKGKPDTTTLPSTEPSQMETTAPTASAESTEPVSPQTDPPETLPPETVPVEPDDDEFVRVADYLPDIEVELRYAAEHNFTGQQIYDFTDAWLRYGTVQKLILVQEELNQSGLCLKIWDAFRPTDAQFKLWEACPDSTYVANPVNGFSSHSRGNTVDITLVHADGTEVVMPTDFDDFSALADRDYSDCDQEAAANARLLEQVMEKYGFKPYSGEWWHFSDTQSYPVEESFQPADGWYFADCREFISLRRETDVSADVITRIPANGIFRVMALDGEFALVDYEGRCGYVLVRYIQPVDENAGPAVPEIE